MADTTQITAAIVGTSASCMGEWPLAHSFTENVVLVTTQDTICRQSSVFTDDEATRNNPGSDSDKHKEGSDVAYGCANPIFNCAAPHPTTRSETPCSEISSEDCDGLTAPSICNGEEATTASMSIVTNDTATMIAKTRAEKNAEKNKERKRLRNREAGRYASHYLRSKTTSKAFGQKATKRPIEAEGNFESRGIVSNQHSNIVDSFDVTPNPSPLISRRQSLTSTVFSNEDGTGAGGTAAPIRPGPLYAEAVTPNCSSSVAMATNLSLTGTLFRRRQHQPYALFQVGQALVGPTARQESQTY